MSGPELLPCPFCGSHDVEVRESITDGLVACNNCGCRTGLVFLGTDAAANAAKVRELTTLWNTRPQAPAMQVDGLVGELAESLLYTAVILDANKNKFAVPDHITVKAEKLRKAASILAALRPSQGWQPIETAPKDGEWYIVGCWVTHDDGSSEWCCWAEPLDGGSLGCEGIYGTECTHWQPLPTPPEKL